MTTTAFSQSQLCEDLRTSCGIVPGQIVIVHSSVRSVGPVEGGAVTIAEALKEAVGPTGTILVPTFSHPQPDGVFSLRDTPSRTGYLTECFRVDPQTVRSKHPTHSVTAWGARAKEFTEGHERTTALGPDSPFHKAAKAGAVILMIGCDLTSCSLVHVTEALARVPYLGRVSYGSYDRPLTLVDLEGKRFEFKPVDLPCDSKGFAKLQAVMEQRGQIDHGKLGAAEVLRLDAGQCMAVADEMLKNDAAALLCDNPKCPVCPPSREIVMAGA